jgi:ABC-type polysaccharide/polyol phosphate transport system ATPase subunit
MGWTNEQIKENEQDVFEFAELEEYRDELFKAYPAGGPGRLGFAMSTIYTTPVYLFDERFTLGGKRHILRGIRRLRKLIAGDDVTFVMTAVNATVAKRICERGLVLDEGEIVFDGPLEEAYAYYKENFVSTGKKKGAVRDPDDSSDEDLDDSSDDDDGFAD